MKITIQNKGVESAPIIIDIQDKNKQSTEYHGASILKTRSFSEFSDIKNDPKWNTILENTKKWMDSKNLVPCTKDDFEKWADKRLDASINSALGLDKPGHKFFASDGVSFICMKTGASTLSSVIPLLNLITAPISVIKQLVKTQNCYLYFACGKRKGSDELVWEAGAFICAYVDKGSQSIDDNK